MKLYNTIIVYDTYVLANSPDEARAALLALIRDGDQPEEPSEQTALEAKNEREIRTAWHDRGPLVASDVSDAEFESIKGKKTLDVHGLLYKKQPKPDDKKANGQKEATK